MMKQEIKTFIFAIALSMTCGMAMAQGYQNGGNRPSREQMVEKQANSIAQQLGLDSKTCKKFVSVYKSEQNDMMNLMPRRGGMGMPPKDGMPPIGQRPTQGERPQGNPPAMNGNKPMGRPQMSDEDKKKVETLKQKYNKKYAKFLSQDQITKVYQLQEQERANRHTQAKQN